MLAPEEGDGVEGLARAQHVAPRHGALPLRDDPMFDANALAAMRIRPTRDVARRIDSRRAGFEKCVDEHAAIHGESRLFREFEPWPHANARDDQFGLQAFPAL